MHAEVIVIGRQVKPAAQELAELVSRISWGDLPSPVRQRTRQLVLDYIGVTLGGASAESSRAVRRFVATLGSGPATVLGAGLATTAEWAALANGTSSHALEMDDVTRVSVLHPGGAVISAALATAEQRNARPVAVLEAVVGGYEVVMRVGAALNGSSAYLRGFHPTGVAGVYGATAAAGSIAGLEAEALVRAFGIAGNFATGSLEYLSDGSWTKRLTPGWAAHGGVVAAGLARVGFTGPATALEGAHGTLHAYSDAANAFELTRDLGTNWQIMEVGIKPYGCCRWTHGLIDCALSLRTRANPDDIDHIELGVLSVGSLLVAEPIERKRRPATPVEAQFSAPFAVATALIHGDVSPSRFTEESLDDERVHALMARTDCIRDAELDADYPDHGMPSRVRLRLRDGRELVERVDFAKGEPERWPTENELIDRFISLTNESLGSRSRAIAERILAMDEESALAPLMRELALHPTPEFNVAPHAASRG